MIRLRSETLGFILVGLAFFSYLFLRAMWLPITHDEAATCANHVGRGWIDLLTYRSDATPNNHILNTVGIKLLAGWFGLNQLPVRLPSLVGGMFYLVAAGGLAQRFAKNAPAVSWFTFLVLLGNAYLAEFFSLSRGYGLASGLLLFAIWQGWRFMEQGRRPALLLAMIFGSLAVLASFTLTNFYLPFVGLLAWAVWEKTPRRREFLVNSWPVWSMVVCMALLCYEPFRRMAATDQFRFWGASGFWTETLLPLVRSSTTSHPYLGQDAFVKLSWLVALTSISGWVIALVRWWQGGRKISQDGRIWVAALFFGTVATNLLQFYIAGTPFLNTRTALFFYPLFALLLAALASWSWERWSWRALFGLVPTTVFVLFNFWHSANLKRTTDWWHDWGTFVALDYLKNQYVAEKRTTPYTLDSDWLVHNSLGFHTHTAQTNYASWVAMSAWHGARPPQGDSEFYYALGGEELAKCREKGYEVVLTVQEGALFLVRRQ